MVSIHELVEKHPALQACAADMQRAFEILRICFRQGGKLLVCGNGGSAADSEHIVGELMKGYLLHRPLPETTRQRLARTCPENGGYLADHLQGALPAIALSSHTSLLTAYANDVAADMVYAQQVYGYGREGDALLGISTSGSARNVIHALQVGRALGLRTIGLTGEGGAMKDFCEALIRAPATGTPEVQELHLAIYHTLCAMLEADFFDR